MNDLVVMKDKQAVTTSLQVAESFGKRHDHVMRDIEELISQSRSPKLGNEMFATGTYENHGKQYPVVYMNRDGKEVIEYMKTRQQKIDYLTKRLSDRDISILKNASEEKIDRLYFIEMSRERKGELK